MSDSKKENTTEKIVVLGFGVNPELAGMLHEQKWRRRMTLSQLCREYVQEGLQRDQVQGDRLSDQSTLRVKGSKVKKEPKNNK